MTFDYYNARKIVNGTDKADAIATIAKKYYTRLKNGELQGGTVVKVDAVTTLKDINVTPGNAVQSIAASVLADTSKSEADTKTNKVLSDVSAEANKFSTIVVSLGYVNGNNYDTTFVWTGIQIDSHELTLNGQSIDAAIHANTVTDNPITYNNTSLKQFASNVALELGISVDIKETELSDQNIEIVNQYPNESKYQVLGRIAKSKGYFLRNTGTTLKLEPMIANARGVVLDIKQFLDYPAYSDKADVNRITGEGLPPIVQGLTLSKKSDTPGTGSDTVATTDLDTGIIRVFLKLSDGSTDDATGFIVNDTGVFITCQHVAKSSIGYAVLKDGSQVNLTYLGQDASLDIAIGKLEQRSQKYPYLHLADKANLQIGDTIAAIGMSQTKTPWNKTIGKVLSLNSFSNVSSGTISIASGVVEGGNSGCPIFNSSNIVVGMAQAIQETTKEGRVIPVEILNGYLSNVTTSLSGVSSVINTNGKNIITDTNKPSPIFTGNTGFNTILDKAKTLVGTQTISNKDVSVTQSQATSAATAVDEKYISNVTAGHEIDKGFELSISYYCDEEILQVLPGDIVTIPQMFTANSSLIGEYKLGSISHGDRNRSQLELYKPVWVKKKSKSGIADIPLSKGSEVLNQPTQGKITDASQLENLTSLRFIIPTPTGVLTSYMGWRNHPVLGGRKFHTGSDYGAAEGDPIVACGAGVVAGVGTGISGYGDNQVLLYHGTVAGKKIFSFYGHNSAYTVAINQLIQQGDKIAKCGSQGISSGNHSHWSVTVGWDWGMNNAFNYPGNDPKAGWVRPESNFVIKAFTGEVDPIGQIDDGTT